MSTTTQDINELPTAGEIINGDRIIIDDGTRTKLVDFKDFIIGLDNVTFKQTIEKYRKIHGIQRTENA
jgi:hypothetical protein